MNRALKGLNSMPKISTYTCAALILLPWALLLRSPASAKDELTLRVNDAIAEPGGVAAIVVRTYSSRGLSSGQLEMEAGSTRVPAGGTAVGPFSALERVQVFAKKRDVSFDAAPRVADDRQTVLLQFVSDSAAVNRTDGPLAVYYFRVRDDVRPGQKFRIKLDTAATMVFDRSGSPVPIRPRSGELTIRSKAAPYLVEAEGDKVTPGETAELGVESFEAVRLARGSIGLRYDPTIAVGTPRVKLSKKYGKRRYSVDRSEPGLVLVEVRSPNASWNRVPGEIVSIRIRTNASARAGTSSRVWLDDSLTFFVDAAGDVLPYRLEGNRVRFERDGGDGDDEDGGPG